MLEYQDWGLIEYRTAWEKQKSLVDLIQKERNKNILVLCEHPSVITIGRSGKDSNILTSKEFLKLQGIDSVEIDRGGDVTLHNPGQLVGYPIFNLTSLKEDLHWFLREIEECIIELLLEFGVNSHRIEGLTGVWVDNMRKICAMGLHCSRWVTSHGFALNINNNLKEFNYIIPCGIKNKEVTSLSKEIGTIVDINMIKNSCLKIFLNHFD